MTDEELEEFQDAMEEQGEELRGALAEDLGGDPDDYRKRPVADGGESSTHD
jgi:isopenicillin N synthase-like dioxygenase